MCFVVFVSVWFHVYVFYVWLCVCWVLLRFLVTVIRGMVIGVEIPGADGLLLNYSITGGAR